jgi:hypothetical protein
MLLLRVLQVKSFSFFFNYILINITLDIIRQFYIYIASLWYLIHCSLVVDFTCIGGRVGKLILGEGERGVGGLHSKDSCLKSYYYYFLKPEIIILTCSYESAHVCFLISV